MSLRPVISTSSATPTIEGAGVHLHRAFGFNAPETHDPFLLFDDFRNDSPDAYINGFPWHPHRGIETITYVLNGSVEHNDSLGNSGTLSNGDVQWMTAGSGIMHQEMPTGNAIGQMHGFQLWANLPGSLKMTNPRYQDVQGKDISEIIDDDGTKVKIITGEFWGKKGPVDGIAADPLYLDISVPTGLRKSFKVDTYRNTFAYIFEGAGKFADASTPKGVLLEKEVLGQELNIRDMSGNRTLVQFGTGDEISVQAGPEGMRFLLVAGTPIKEPVAWHGPIVMNTREELQTAFNDLRNCKICNSFVISNTFFKKCFFVNNVGKISPVMELERKLSSYCFNRNPYFTQSAISSMVCKPSIFSQNASSSACEITPSPPKSIVSNALSTLLLISLSSSKFSDLPRLSRMNSFNSSRLISKSLLPSVVHSILFIKFVTRF